jgi:serine/threonine-protein kinase
MDYIQAHVNAKPIPIAERTGKEFPPLLWPVIERALAKEPEARYASAADFATAMQAILAGATTLPPSLSGAPPAVEPPVASVPVPAPKKSSAAPAPAREQLSTRPDRAPQKLSTKPPPKSQTGLLIGVAAACLILGVVMTIVAMKMLGR